MRLRRYSVRVQSLSVLTALLLTAVAVAETRSNRLSRIAIKNFGCVNENYFRGAQPQKQDYEVLASLGIKTVIDLQRDGEAGEQEMVESHGMRFFRFGMTTTDQPNSQTVSQFLKIVTDPANQPVFVHCRGGRHRTGVMTAIYRLTQDSFTADQAYAEMKRYEFDKGFGHGALKQYVYDYFAGLDRQNTAHDKSSVKAMVGGSRN